MSISPQRMRFRRSAIFSNFEPQISKKKTRIKYRIENQFTQKHQNQLLIDENWTRYISHDRVPHRYITRFAKLHFKNATSLRTPYTFNCICDKTIHTNIRSMYDDTLSSRNRIRRQLQNGPSWKLMQKTVYTIESVWHNYDI